MIVLSGGVSADTMLAEGNLCLVLMTVSVSMNLIQYFEYEDYVQIGWTIWILLVYWLFGRVSMLQNIYNTGEYHF